MSTRLIILLVAAAGLAIFFATRTPSPVGVKTEEVDEVLEIAKLLLQERDLEGEEPEEEADLDIRVDVDTSTGKNRLVYYLSESHGYYVETFEVAFWYKPTADTERYDSPFRTSQFFNKFLKVDETLEGCFELTSTELDRFGGDIGTGENWEAEINRYGRARLANPDPLPPLVEVTSCD